MAAHTDHATLAALDPGETERLTRRGLRLAQFTVGYNVIEGAVAITAGATPASGTAGSTGLCMSSR